MAGSPAAGDRKLVGAFGATLPARFARYGNLVGDFVATLPARLRLATAERFGRRGELR